MSKPTPSDRLAHRRCAANAPDRAARGDTWRCPHGLTYHLLPGIYGDMLRWQPRKESPADRDALERYVKEDDK